MTLLPISFQFLKGGTKLWVLLQGTQATLYQFSSCAPATIAVAIAENKSLLLSICFIRAKLSVTGQKGESQNGCFKKAKDAKFSEKRTYVCVSGGKKCLFFGRFGVLCFLETPVLRFALSPYYHRSIIYAIFVFTLRKVA